MGLARKRTAAWNIRCDDVGERLVGGGFGLSGSFTSICNFDFSIRFTGTFGFGLSVHAEEPRGMNQKGGDGARSGGSLVTGTGSSVSLVGAKVAAGGLGNWQVISAELEPEPLASAGSRIPTAPLFFTLIDVAFFPGGATLGNAAALMSAVVISGVTGPADSSALEPDCV